MVSIEDYRLFVKVLNRSFKSKNVMTKDEFVMIASLELRLMSPSKAKQVLDDVLKAGIIQKRGDYILIDSLWDPSKREYVVRSQKTGKTLKTDVSKPKDAPKRTVKYAGPGHTVVGYEHRTLHIRFPETKKEFEAKAKARRKASARKRSSNSSVLVDRDASGNMIFISKGGSDVGLRARSTTDKGKAAIIKKNLSKDRYTIEDMRAMLKDDHWEEVSGNKRWNYDKKATVREFNKYLKTRL